MYGLTGFERVFLTAKVMPEELKPVVTHNQKKGQQYVSTFPDLIFGDAVRMISNGSDLGDFIFVGATMPDRTQNRDIRVFFYSMDGNCPGEQEQTFAGLSIFAQVYTDKFRQTINRYKSAPVPITKALRQKIYFALFEHPQMLLRNMDDIAIAKNKNSNIENWMKSIKGAPSPSLGPHLSPESSPKTPPQAPEPAILQKNKVKYNSEIDPKNILDSQERKR